MPKKPEAPDAGPPTSDKQAKGDPRFSAALDRWKGGVSLAVLVAELKVTRSQLRRELTRLLGGKDAFKAQRATGAGGKAEPFGGTRSSRPRASSSEGDPASSEVVFRDDGVPFVADTSKSAGWSWRVEYQTKTVRISEKGKDAGTALWREVKARIHIDPDGVEYIQARPNERADLIRLSPMPSMPNVRLRRLETSSVARKLQREEEQLERGKAALERTQARKRSAREARVTRKAPDAS